MAIDLIYDAKAKEWWIPRLIIHKKFVKSKLQKRKQAKLLEIWNRRLKRIAYDAFHSKMKSQEVFKIQQCQESI